MFIVFIMNRVKKSNIIKLKKYVDRNYRYSPSGGFVFRMEAKEGKTCREQTKR